MEEIRAKSAAAEALIEELMEENEELKKDMRLMVDEMDELQDNFRFIFVGRCCQLISKFST